MPKTSKLLSRPKKLEIVGRYLFDYGEGWSIINTEHPYRIEKKKCFMCEGKGIFLESKCDMCNGTGKIDDYIYPFDPDRLADFLSPLLESGDRFKITVEMIERKPATMWKGKLEEGKGGSYLLTKNDVKEEK